MPGPVRADFEEIMDDFLERFEVLGGKMKPVMSGKTAVEKLDTLRTELLGPNDPDSCAERAAVKDQILQKLKADQRAHDRQALSSSAIKSHQERFMTLPNDDHLQNKWDCQTILSTFNPLPPLLKKISNF
jgi:protein LTV1